MFDGDVSVTEAGIASVCVTISSSATSLGCDLTVTLTTADGKATSKMFVFMLFTVIIVCLLVFRS